MRKLTMFNNVSLDGYFTDAAGDMSWAHAGADAEWAEFTAGNATGESEAIFGRVTWQMMASFWPTDMAKQQMPSVAAAMNRMTKYVFSRSYNLSTATMPAWENTVLWADDDIVEGVGAIKGSEGPDLIVMGSGTIVAPLTEGDLIDSYQLVIVPVILGGGRTLFEGVARRPRLKRTGCRAFGNGNVVLTYEPERG